jgi:glycosyltransferase involved in cell wall biosynthesis
MAKLARRRSVPYDVAIYSPQSASLYDRTVGRAPGGAELQTTLLASALAARGMRVAMVVFPMVDPERPREPNLTLLERVKHAGRTDLVGHALEAERMWRALRTANARVYVVRTGTPSVGLAGLFCSVHKRALIFSSAGTNDFTLEDFVATPGRRIKLYRFGIRAADAVVVQTGQQVDLAREVFPGISRTVEIPSFVGVPEQANQTARDPDAFVWISRLVPLKRPLRYVELARALPQARFQMIAVEGNQTPPELASELRESAAATPNLELLEPLPHTETGRLLGRSVAAVNTSEREGLSNVFLEAWARGVPVLSLDVDPDGRIAEHGLGIAAGGSWQRFVAGARELWEGRQDRDGVTRQTREYVERFHSEKSVGDRWAALVDELISG